ncbi:MAG: hypothetical protein RR964_07395 [Lachnospiraceae bacterium]
MNEHILLIMSRMPVHEQKKLRMQRKAPKVRFANGMAELLHLKFYL